MKTPLRFLLLFALTIISFYSVSATPPNVTVGTPYPRIVLEGTESTIVITASGISAPSYPDFLWYCHYGIVNHDGEHSYEHSYAPELKLPYDAAPGYYKAFVNVCGQSGSYDFYSADSVFRIIPNDFIGRSVTVSPAELPANSPMEITATISAENGLAASFDALNIGTDQESYVSDVVLMKDGAIVQQDLNFKCNGNTLKANFNFTEADTGLYVLRIGRTYTNQQTTYIYGQNPIHVTKSTIQPYITSFGPNSAYTGDIANFSLEFKYLHAGSGTSESQDNKIRRLYLAKPDSDTIDILTYYYLKNSIYGYICVPHTADTGTYSIFAEVLTDNGTLLLSSDSYKLLIINIFNTQITLSADPKEITCGDSVTITVTCTSKFYVNDEFNCYISNTLRDEQYPTSGYVFLSDSIFTCRAFVPETLSTQFCNIMVTNNFGYHYGVAALKANRRQYGISIAPDSVIAGESQFFDVKVSHLSERMRFTSALPQEVSANYCGRRYVPDSIYYTNDSTFRCRFNFPFVAEKKPISFTLIYPFGTIDVGKASEFSVIPARKIVGVSNDTLIGGTNSSIVITTSDDNFDVPDIKSIRFSSEDPTTGGTSGGGANNKSFTSYEFKKVGPAQLQAWFHTNYEDSSCVYYISILKTDSSVWLPMAGQKIVVINPMLGAEDNQNDGMIRVEPNPAGADAQLVIGKGIIGEASISVIGIDGSESETKLFLNNRDSESKHLLSNFVCSPGFYLIRLKCNGITHTVKCIISE